MAIDMDVGSYNLVCSRRADNGEVKTRREVNAFLKMSLSERQAFNLMKDNDIPLIEFGDRDTAYMVGEAAVNMAYAFNIELKRPMKDGCINPYEVDAYEILGAMLHGLIGGVSHDKELLYFSVPANAINQETDADLHQKALESIFKKYNVNGKTIEARPINEGLALVYAELKKKNYTGISISFGAGMVNLCYAVFAQPVFKMSLVNSGDWIDKQAAKACGETPVVINKEKTKIDLTKSPTSIVERAIHFQYRILIEKTMTSIKTALVENKVRTNESLDIVIGGGTASPNGFEQLVQEIVKESKYPIPIGEIIKPQDHLYAVSRGALIAAENAMIH